MRYGGSSAVECADTDLNGYEEVKWVGEDVIVRFDSRYGGQLVEFCDRKRLFNFQNVLTRRKESYHEKISESAADTSETKPKEEGISTIHGAAHRAGEAVREDFIKNGFNFSIEMESKSPHIYEYGIEMNLHFANLEDVMLEKRPIGTGTYHEMRSFEIEDRYTGRVLRFETDHFFSLLATKLQTVSQSEEGYELMTQGITLMAVFPFSKKLSVGGSLRVLDV